MSKLNGLCFSRQRCDLGPEIWGRRDAWQKGESLLSRKYSEHGQLHKGRTWSNDCSKSRQAFIHHLKGIQQFLDIQISFSIAQYHDGFPALKIDQRPTQRRASDCIALLWICGSRIRCCRFARSQYSDLNSTVEKPMNRSSTWLEPLLLIVVQASQSHNKGTRRWRTRRATNSQLGPLLVAWISCSFISCHLSLGCYDAHFLRGKRHSVWSRSVFSTQA